jgi:hypothetical protein
MVRFVTAFLGFEPARDERESLRRNQREGEQGGVSGSQLGMRYEIIDSVELARPLGFLDELGSWARPQSRYSPDPSYPLREICPFSLGQPGTGRLACGAHGQSSQTNAMSLRLVSATPLRITDPNNPKISAKADFTAGRYQSGRYPRIPSTIWIKKALFPTV